MEKMVQCIIKWSIRALAKKLGQANYSLYHLEEQVFEFFQPIQKEVLEKTAVEASLKQSNESMKCSCGSILRMKGIRKKNFSADLA